MPKMIQSNPIKNIILSRNNTNSNQSINEIPVKVLNNKIAKLITIVSPARSSLSIERME